jgi:septal ring factor EnvC (AmiA/AmiB activator)
MGTETAEQIGRLQGALKALEDRVDRMDRSGSSTESSLAQVQANHAQLQQAYVSAAEDMKEVKADVKALLSFRGLLLGGAGIISFFISVIVAGASWLFGKGH